MGFNDPMSQTENQQPVLIKLGDSVVINTSSRGCHTVVLSNMTGGFIKHTCLDTIPHSCSSSSSLSTSSSAQVETDDQINNKNSNKTDDIQVTSVLESALRQNNLVTTTSTDVSTTTAANSSKDSNNCTDDSYLSISGYQHSLKESLGPCQLSARLLLTSSNNHAKPSYACILKYICSIPSKVIFHPSDMESITTTTTTAAAASSTNTAASTEEYLYEKASVICSQDSIYLGFSLVQSTNTTPACALLFSDAGYPLHKYDYSTSIKTYIKVISPTPGDEMDDMINKNGNNKETVVTIESSSNNNSEVSTNPLVTNPISHVSNLSESLISSEPTVQVFMKYIPLGGGLHNDSLKFDATRFIWQAVDSLSSIDVAALTSNTSISTEATSNAINTTITIPDNSSNNSGYNNNSYNNISANIWSNLKLNKIECWAGESLVNGLQCYYALNTQLHESNPLTIDSEEHLKQPIPIHIESPLFSSTHDNPQKFNFSLQPFEDISNIIVNAGALVDGITFKTTLGQSFHVGGHGGSPRQVTEIMHFIMIF